jgi:hypothetical protein
LSGTARIRLPLEYALAVSPVILLSPSFLHRATNLDRGFMIQVGNPLCPRNAFPSVVQVWQSQASDRPPPLVAVERAIWTFIRDIALGTDRVLQDSPWISDIQAALKGLEHQALRPDWFGPLGMCTLPCSDLSFIFLSRSADRQEDGISGVDSVMSANDTDSNLESEDGMLVDPAPTNTATVTQQPISAAHQLESHAPEPMDQNQTLAVNLENANALAVTERPVRATRKLKRGRADKNTTSTYSGQLTTRVVKEKCYEVTDLELLQVYLVSLLSFTF